MLEWYLRVSDIKETLQGKIMKNKLFVSLFTLALAVLMGWVVALSTPKIARAMQSNNYPAYTLNQIERVIMADGTEYSRTIRTTGRRSDGSKAVKEIHHYKVNGKAWEMPQTHIYDVGNERLTALYPRITAKISEQLHPLKVARLQQHSENSEISGSQLKSELVPIAFHQTQLRETPKMIGADRDVSLVEKHWVVPTLNCAVLQEENVATSADGKPRWTRYVDFISLKVGEPEASLFEIPFNFQEMIPSQVMMAQNQQEGRECRKCELNTLSNSDRAYYANRPKK
ncbi:MAG: hypothetical protein NW208_08630 [Bryobacter sp.]|nr:hypothetical protein [Bryobacter sp.]